MIVKRQCIVNKILGIDHRGNSPSLSLVCEGGKCTMEVELGTRRPRLQPLLFPDAHGEHGPVTFVLAHLLDRTVRTQSKGRAM